LSQEEIEPDHPSSYKVEPTTHSFCGAVIGDHSIFFDFAVTHEDAEGKESVLNLHKYGVRCRARNGLASESDSSDGDYLDADRSYSAEQAYNSSHRSQDSSMLSTPNSSNPNSGACTPTPQHHGQVNMIGHCDNWDECQWDEWINDAGDYPLSEDYDERECGDAYLSDDSEEHRALQESLERNS
jgi:hypothetical protein